MVFLFVLRVQWTLGFVFVFDLKCHSAFFMSFGFTQIQMTFHTDVLNVSKIFLVSLFIQINYLKY